VGARGIKEDFRNLARVRCLLQRPALWGVGGGSMKLCSVPRSEGTGGSNGKGEFRRQTENGWPRGLRIHGSRDLGPCGVQPPCQPGSSSRTISPQRVSQSRFCTAHAQPAMAAGTKAGGWRIPSLSCRWGTVFSATRIKILK